MIFENAYNLLEFDKRGKILSVRSKKTERDYLISGGCDIFRLILSEEYKGRIVPGTLTLTSEMAERVRIEQEGENLKIYCENLDGMAISVICDISFHSEDIQWRISVKNQTRFAVKEIEYPFLLLKPYLGYERESERILLPKMDGILLGNPELHPWGKNSSEIISERCWYPGEGKEVPTNLAVQMTAYYDGKEGVLIYAADTEGHPKKMGPIYCRNKYIDLTPVHLRPEQGRTDVTLDYKVVTRFFKGDWKDAADIYMQFASSAPWCVRKITEREDIPDWIKKGAFFLSFRLRYQDSGEQYLDYVPEYVKKWHRIFDIPIVAMMCGWEKTGEWAGPDYFPLYGGKEKFQHMCSDLIRNGDIPFTFGLSGLKLLIRRHRTKSKEQPELALDYDGRELFERKYRESAALNVDGTPIMDSEIDSWDGIHGYACAATGQAEEQICTASIKMLQDYDVLMQQADQVLGGGTTECYSGSHGHPPGRGKWQTESLQKIYDKTRKKGKSINKDFALSQEWISEPFIQHLDIYHGRNYDKPQGGLESVPLFSYLYHPYIPCYAGDWTSMLPDNRTGVYFHGWNFVCGNLPAGSPLNMLAEMKNHEPDEADIEILEMASNACAALKKETEYLVCGKMLPTEELPVSRKEICIEGLDFGFVRRKISVPVVLHMFWQNKYGKVACALANISDDMEEINVPVGKYWTEGKKVNIDLNGKRDLSGIEIINGGLRFRLPARSAAVIREED